MLPAKIECLPICHIFCFKVRQNQEFQKKIDAVQAKIRSREAAVADLAVQLKSAETILQQALDETALAVAAIKQSQQNQGRINVHTLINYSAKVAETSGKMQGANTKEPFPSVEAFQHARLFKELVNKKSDLQTTIENLESETQYQSFLGDLTTTTAAENDEELADF